MKNVFWDWNGTLCDDLFLALEAVNAMLAKRGRQPIGLQTYYSYMDTPISRFYAHLFDFGEVSMEQLSVEFRTYYDAHLRRDCLMSGAKETLQILKNVGVRQYLLSSSHRDSILPTVDRLGLLPFFEEILAADDWHVTSKAERARAFCDAHHLRGEDTWFIGDLLHDRDAAALCGAHCLLIPAGHQSEEDLRKTGNCFCPSVSQVPARLGIMSVSYESHILENI